MLLQLLRSIIIVINYYKAVAGNAIDEDKHNSFMALKENLYLFHAGLKSGFLYD